MENSKELVVYHGSCYEFENIELNKSHNRRDFGKGFYTTILKSQSKEWGYRLSLREKKKNYFIYEYLFEENSVLNVKRFDTLSEEWLEFIKENRSKGGLQHKYDVVIGPVADDNTMETVQLYIANILTASEAVERLRYNKVNNQVSFHTEKALQYLHLVRRILMSEMIYSFNGKDITMNVCIQIRDVLKLLQEHFNISFEEAALRFYKSETYKTLQETENGLWAESAEYIADRYCDEIKDNVEV